MMTTLPVSYGHAVYSAMPTLPLPAFDAWITVGRAEGGLQGSGGQYHRQRQQAMQTLESQRLLEQLEGKRRIDYVRAQQHLQEAKPDFNDPELMRSQVELLARTL